MRRIIKVRYAGSPRLGLRNDGDPKTSVTTPCARNKIRVCFMGSIEIQYSSHLLEIYNRFTSCRTEEIEKRILDEFPRDGRSGNVIALLSSGAVRITRVFFPYYVAIELRDKGVYVLLLFTELRSLYEVRVAINPHMFRRWCATSIPHHIHRLSVVENAVCAHWNLQDFTFSISDEMRSTCRTLHLCANSRL